MKRILAAVLFAAGYAMSVGAPAILIGAAPVMLSGCERDSDSDSDLEDAAEDLGDKIEDAGEEAEDKLD